MWWYISVWYGSSGSWYFLDVVAALVDTGIYRLIIIIDTSVVEAQTSISPPISVTGGALESLGLPRIYKSDSMVNIIWWWNDLVCFYHSFIYQKTDLYMNISYLKKIMPWNWCRCLIFYFSGHNWWQILLQQGSEKLPDSPSS